MTPTPPVEKFSRGFFPSELPRMVPIAPIEDLDHSSTFFALLIIDGIFACVAFLANVLLIIVIYKARDVLLKRPFYYILMQMIFCTTLKALIQIGLVLPSFAAPLKVSEGSKKATVFLDTFADFGILFFSTLVAINRFLVFAVRGGDKLLTKKGIATSSSLCWLLTTSISTVILALGCTRMFDPISSTYYDVCLGERSAAAATFIAVTTYVVYGLCIFNFLIYVFLIINIRQTYGSTTQKAGSKAASPEFSILLQSLVLFALYSVFVLLFSLLPLLTLPREQFFLITFSTNSLSVFIALSYPLFLLATTQEARILIINTCRSLSKTPLPLINTDKISNTFTLTMKT